MNLACLIRFPEVWEFPEIKKEAFHCLENSGNNSESNRMGPFLNSVMQYKDEIILKIDFFKKKQIF